MATRTTAARPLFILLAVTLVASFAPPNTRPSPRHVDLAASTTKVVDVWSKFLGSAVLVASLVVAAPAWADEIGRETEAPTLFTGESVMICKKRGPLGACLETEVRTELNDNDRAKRYFKDPALMVKQRKDAEALEKETEGNALIAKLRQQTEDNKEKNDSIVRRKTLENDQSASFGPFDRQVVILNADGNSYTLLENPQAMRLKKAGFIKDRKFVTQPTKQELDDALVAPENLFDGISKAVFGDAKKEVVLE